MIRLLERNIAAIDRHLLLLAPPDAELPSQFDNVTSNSALHALRLRELQQMRGSAYLADGAVSPQQLASDGAHVTPEDDRSWHVLMVNDDGRVIAGAWYLQHAESVRFADLRVRRCPLVRTAEWSEPLRRAVDSDIQRARREGICFAEVGGWAVARQNRCTSSGLLLALATYSLGELLGGTLALTTATFRHSSSAILRRIGGAPLATADATVPPYYDPAYSCDMELLRFDSREPSRRFAGLVQALQERLADVAVLAHTGTTHLLPRTFRAEAAEVAA